MTVPDKWKWVLENKVCISCLRKGHPMKNCRRRKRCPINNCQRTHHKSLHAQTETSILKSIPDVATTNIIQVSAPNVESSLHTFVKSEVLLRVLPVTLYGPATEISTFALLDDGSTVTLIDESIANQLGAESSIEPLTLRWIDNNATRDVNSKMLSIKIRGDNCNEIYDLKNVRTTKNLKLPIQSIDIQKLSEKYSYIDHISLSSYINAVPTILIGQDHCNLILMDQVIQNSPNTPVLSHCSLEWVLHGIIDYCNSRVGEFTFTTSKEEIQIDDLHDQVKKYFITEEFGVKVVKQLPQSIEERRSKMIMNNTMKRIDNHFETGLLWKSDDIIMPESKNQALLRLKYVERKMDKDPEYAKKYCENIEQYLVKGYAKKLSIEEAKFETNKTWYLPHFGVMNPNKPGKLRFVFDAAAKSNNVSLNDCLMKGPDYLCSLVGVLLKFRQLKIGFCADIREMFHQINIKSDDMHAQRFLWRGMNRESSPDVYVMRAMTFGATCSPCLAQEAKNRNAREFEEQFPEACKAITTKHYVDDYLDSAETEEKANKLISDVIHVHKQGGFELRNWICSNNKVFNEIPINLKKQKNMNLEEDANERVLGLYWNSDRDIFTFDCKFHKIKNELLIGETRPTKREVLKVVMSVYDPLGFLSHFMIKAKILLQFIWRSGIGWDDEITDVLNLKWLNWLEELHQVKQFEIPRWFSIICSMKPSIQLHIFCDASEQAFAVVSYLRIKTSNKIDTSFVMSKTRVAPLKPMSIPRLELQAAVMATRLSKFIINELEIEIDCIKYWTDSQTVLQWLRSDAKIFKPFVAHRIGEIEEMTNVNEWHWVPTKFNVADDATRDRETIDFSSTNRWLQGPDFLKLPEEYWPTCNQKQI